MDLLKIKNLEVYVKEQSKKIQIIKGIDINVKEGETVAIIGESGCGKSITMKSITNLNKKNVISCSDYVKFNDIILDYDDKKEIRKLLGSEIGFIFQNPINSLNPLYRVEHQLYEVIDKHNKNLKKEEKLKKVYELLKIVRIKNIKLTAKKFPHQLSGGQIQRIMIAIAIANNPKLLIADEPTTALDVTVQREIMILLKKLIDERKMASIFISHNLSLVRFIADYVYIMYNGYILECGKKSEIFENPIHYYTKNLLECQIEYAKKNEKIPTILKKSNFNNIPGNIFDLRDDIDTKESLINISKLEKITETHYVRRYI